jgi:DNA repair protein RadC
MVAASGRGERRVRDVALLAALDRDLGARTEAELIARILGGCRPAAEMTAWGGRLSAVPLWERRALGAAGLVREYEVPTEPAIRLAAVWELAERWYPDDRPTISSPRDAMLLLERLRFARREQVTVVLLDARHRPTGIEVVAVGSLNASRLAPRDILAPALRADAAAVILAHNHPSGDPAPSRADRVITAALRCAGEVVGVPMLDHLIVARRGHFSFRESEGWDEGAGRPQESSAG